MCRKRKMMKDVRNREIKNMIKMKQAERRTNMKADWQKEIGEE